jgi:hypothetical protein
VNPQAALSYRKLFFKCHGWNNAGGGIITTYGAANNLTGAINAVKLTFSSGNITAGTFKLYGVVA